MNEVGFEIKDLNSLIRYQLKIVSDSCQAPNIWNFIASVNVLECYLTPYLDKNYWETVEEYKRSLIRKYGEANIVRYENVRLELGAELSHFKLKLLMVKINELLPKEVKAV
jgi:hypothetical protein